MAEREQEGGYAASYLVRLFVHDVLRYNFLLMSDDELKGEEDIAGRQIVTAVRAFRELCKTDGAELLIVVHPFGEDVTAGKYVTPAFERAAHDLEEEPGISFVDLSKVYSREKNITKDTAREFFWTLDLHHNTKGYRIMGDAIADHIVSADLVDNPTGGTGVR